MAKQLGAMFIAAMLPPGIKNIKLIAPFLYRNFNGPDGYQLHGGCGVHVPACNRFPVLLNIFLICLNIILISSNIIFVL